MELSICSYSFHRLLEAGQQDVFKFISDCHALGCTQLDLWNGHLPSLLDDEAHPELLASLLGPESHWEVHVAEVAGSSDMTFE